MTRREPREDLVSAAMAERKDMLLLAQQKLDEIHRCNIGLSGGRPGSSASNRRKSAMSNHLLSSLLYVALMSYKIEDMKALLHEEDHDTFVEWEVLLNSLHSPEFHVKERIINNKRVKTAYERKRQYKDVSNGLQQELTDTSNKLVELQRISNETSQQMSRTINVLQDERTALVSKGEARENEINELKEELNELRSQLDRSEAEEKRKSEELDHLKQQLEMKESKIKDIELRNSQLIQEQGVAKEKTLGQDKTIAELTSRIEMIESKFASSTSEKESLINSLHQNLKESEARHAAAKANLESSKAELAESKKEMERMKSIESRLDTLASNSESSFADVKSLLLNVEGTSSRTESLVKTTNELQAEANVATSSWLAKEQVFDNMIEGNERLQAKVTELSCQSSEIHQSFSAMQRDVAATNESLVKLERLSYRIKGSLSDVQIGLSAASTNDVIIARLESRSAHNEEMLLNIQQGLERTLLKANIDAVEKQTNLTLSTLQESLNGMQKQNEALEKIQESLAQMRGLRHQKSDPATAEALNRLGDRTHEISDTLTSIHALLKVPANNPHTPSSSQIPNQESYATETHSSSTNDDTPIDESNLDNQSNASALAANNLIANCVSEAISAMSPSKILVTN